MSNYYCEHSTEIVVLNSNRTDVKCPFCSAIMTFGKWTNRTPDLILFQDVPEHEEIYIHTKVF